MILNHLACPSLSSPLCMQIKVRDSVVMYLSERLTIRHYPDWNLSWNAYHRSILDIYSLDMEGERSGRSSYLWLINEADEKKALKQGSVGM